MNLSKYLILFSVSFVMACSQPQETNSSDTHSKPLVVFLARHGEKVDQSRDPELSPAGYVRAATLAHSLKDAGIQQVHSTNYIRTRKTAEPSAAIHGVEVELYDPGDLKSFADRLRKMGGRHLVLGHSDTTPRLVKLLGGDPGTDIHEPDEYDRLYLISIDGAGEVSTVLLRYGVPYVPDYQ